MDFVVYVNQVLLSKFMFFALQLNSMNLRPNKFSFCQETMKFMPSHLTNDFTEFDILSSLATQIFWQYPVFSCTGIYFTPKQNNLKYEIFSIYIQTSNS
jgi:hypothetical protein